MLAHCPRCQSSFEASHVIGDNAICKCGWSGSLSQKKKSRFSFSFSKKNQFSSKKKFSSKSLLNFGLIAFGIFGFAYGAQEWKGFMVERAVYTFKGSIKLNSSNDEFRMAVICHKLAKQECKEIALARAYKLDPTNVELNGEYAISLSEAGKHDPAILAFQKFFSQSPGTWRHKFNFAISLGEKEFYTDAKEQYYKAIVENPDNLLIPETMMAMLSKAHMYGEAMSIIGHFNMSIPQTQKLWHELSIKLKTEFKDYQAKFAIKEMTISKLGSYFFAPGILGGSLETQLFIVNPEAVYTTVDMAYLKANGIPFESKGQITVQPSNGAELTGTRIILPTLMFGAWTLNNVEAIACDNCAFMAGKGILGQLSVQTSQINETRVNLLSMKEK